MISAFKKLFASGKELNAGSILANAKNEREALLLLKESRKRDEERREKANLRLKEIADQEQKYMDEGKQEGIASFRKMHLVRMIKQGREETKDLLYKVEKIYTPRLKSLQAHIQSLETVIEVKNEPVPQMKEMEDKAIEAKNLMEDLDQAVELAHGINSSKDKIQHDQEDEAILEELNTLAEEERAKEHAKAAEKAQKEKEKESKREKRNAKRTDEGKVLRRIIRKDPMQECHMEEDK